MVLALFKDSIRERFQKLLTKQTPDIQTPVNPEDALALGYRMGLKDGYGEGLVDGVDLGLEDIELPINPIEIN